MDVLTPIKVGWIRPVNRWNHRMIPNDREPITSMDTHPSGARSPGPSCPNFTLQDRKDLTSSISTEHAKQRPCVAGVSWQIARLKLFRVSMVFSGKLGCFYGAFWINAKDFFWGVATINYRLWQLKYVRNFPPLKLGGRWTHPSWTVASYVFQKGFPTTFGSPGCVGSNFFGQTVIQNPDNLSVDLKRPHLRSPCLPDWSKARFVRVVDPWRRVEKHQQSQGPVVACGAGHLDVEHMEAKRDVAAVKRWFLICWLVSQWSFKIFKWYRNFINFATLIISFAWCVTFFLASHHRLRWRGRMPCCVTCSI